MQSHQDALPVAADTGDDIERDAGRDLARLAGRDEPRGGYPLKHGFLDGELLVVIVDLAVVYAAGPVVEQRQARGAE